MFKKILIANRGEIAVRILRACQELGIATVAVHSMADSEAMHVRLADESVCVGPYHSSESYLNMVSILSAAEVTGADAIHPGFGFLSENSAFASMVQDHGLTFIGPSPHHMAIMGHKTKAKEKARELGLETIIGSHGEIESLAEASHIADTIGYPILLKATAGGGGKGMRVVYHGHDLKDAMESAQQESMISFGSNGIYMEKYLQKPRHVEFQILGDLYGNLVCLGERDCSLQRNHQKVWEEAPCPVLTQEQRQEMVEKVTVAMKVFGYTSLGTLEFLYEDGRFYFIEMNTRIQVEHPVTEMITGLDLVKTQILLAAGTPLSFAQKDVFFHGHAIECRINAEHPFSFIPSPGKIEAYLPPGGPFVRVDSGLFSGYTIPPYYDSLVAKLVVHGQNRQECLSRLYRALNEYVITGIKTLIPLHQSLCQHPDIQMGLYDIRWLENHLTAEGLLP